PLLPAVPGLEARHTRRPAPVLLVRDSAEIGCPVPSQPLRTAAPDWLGADSCDVLDQPANATGGHNPHSRAGGSQPAPFPARATRSCPTQVNSVGGAGSRGVGATVHLTRRAYGQVGVLTESAARSAECHLGVVH